MHFDELSQYHSKPRGFGKVVKEREMKRSEWAEQLTLCKWLKHEYPDILFRSDIQSAGKLSPQMQNIKQIIDPYSGWPDVMIYLPNQEGNCGLAIELKSLTASLSGEHYRNQQAMHDRLRHMNWKVEVCKGSEAAKDVFIKYFRSI